MPQELLPLTVQKPPGVWPSSLQVLSMHELYAAHGPHQYGRRRLALVGCFTPLIQWSGRPANSETNSVLDRPSVISVSLRPAWSSSAGQFVSSAAWLRR